MEARHLTTTVEQTRSLERIHHDETLRGLLLSARMNARNGPRLPPPELENGTDAALEIAAGLFLREAVGASCSWLRLPWGQMHTQGWHAGEFLTDSGIPACMEISGIRRALYLTQECVAGTPRLRRFSSELQIHAFWAAFWAG